MMKSILPLDQMTKSEKLQAMEELWADLSRNPNDIDPPEWHGKVLEERVRAVREGRDSFIPWGEAKKNLRDKHT